MYQIQIHKEVNKMQINKKNFYEKLKKQIPEFKGLWEKNLYTLHFMDLSELTIQAHKKNNKNLLKRIYSFTESCINSKDTDIYNAVGVSFFEIIIKNPIVRKEIGNYISRKTLYKVLNLWRWILEKKLVINSLLKSFGFTNEEIKEIHKEPVWINNKIYPFKSKIIKND